MKTTQQQKKHSRVRSICMSAALCTALLAGLTIPAMAAEGTGLEPLPISGSTAQQTTAVYSKKAQLPLTAPEGYQKKAYKVADDPLEYYQNKKAPKDAVSRDDAAERGAQMLWELFGLDMTGKTVYMGFDPGSESYPQPTWSGDVRDGNSRTPQDDDFTFTIDAVTGERLCAAMGRTISEKVNLGLDSALAKNPAAYLDLAKKAAEKHSILGEKIKTAEYNCQGYSGNDPDISIDVTGENGAAANLVFSRYDKALKAVSYPKDVKISSEAHAKFLKSLGIRES